jgi:maleylpyruvate isomerase
VASIDDETARQPSLLPGWDVAMVVSHLARNADGHAWVAEGARLGESRQRYADPEEREAGIQAGRGRRADELLGDLRAAVDRLEDAWAAMPPEAWAVVARSATGEAEPLVELPLYRWRESEVHHVDLGLAFTIVDWSQAFVDHELEVWVEGLDERLPDGTGAIVTATDVGASWTVGAPNVTMQVAAPSRSLLAWLIGRRTDGFPDLAPWSW